MGGGEGDHNSDGETKEGMWYLICHIILYHYSAESIHASMGDVETGTSLRSHTNRIKEYNCIQGYGAIGRY